MDPGSVHSTRCGPTMNIREWVPHQNLGPGCPWCKAGLAHHGPDRSVIELKSAQATSGK
jgi:hypothetical protein